MPRIPTAILIKREEVDEVSQNEVDPAYPRVIRREVIEFPPIVADPPSIASTFQEESESECEVGLGLRNEIQEESLTVGEEIVHPYPTKIERTSDCSSSSQESLMEDNNSSSVSPPVVPVGSLIKLKGEGLGTSSLRNVKLERIKEQPFQNPFSRTSVNRESPLMLHKKSNSVVQTLLNRELSIAVFSRCGDYTCPLDLDVLIGRQLVRSRAPESNGKSVKPSKLDLHKKLRNNGRSPNGETWLQINVPDKSQIISIIDNLWLRATQGTGAAADMGSVNEEFYSMEPFKQLRSFRSENSSLGNLEAAGFLNWQPTTKDRTSTYLLTLTKSGHLRLYDICKRQIFHEIKLNRSGTARFTSFDNCDTTGRIWVMATEKSVVKTILVLSYPPWKKVDVIHIRIPVMISLSSQVCILLQGKTLKLTTWPYLIKKVQYTKREDRTCPPPTNDLPVGFEGILSELPIIFSQSTLQTDDCGFVDVLLPMFYGNYKTGIKFYLPFDNMRQPDEALYEFVVPSTDNVEDPIKVIPFPDESYRVLICSQYNYEVVSLKLNRKWKSVEVVQTSQPFNHWDHQTDLSAGTSDNAARQRPQRSCIKNQPRISLDLNKHIVYGIQFSPYLNLLAVLTADDEEFQVVIYEPSTLKVFRSLPAVLAWPSVKRTGDLNPRRELVEPDEFCFCPEFIFVSFVYAGQSKQHREAFFIRLLNELF